MVLMLDVWRAGVTHGNVSKQRQASRQGAVLSRCAPETDWKNSPTDSMAVPRL